MTTFDARATPTARGEHGSSPSQTMRAALVPGGILLAARLLPLPQAGAIAGLPSLCLFHRVTGLPCPGCGMTRALVCGAHGQWRDAAWYHPLGPLVFALLLAWMLCALLPRARPGWHLRLPGVFIQRAALTGAALLLLVWAVRLAGVLPLPP